MHTEGRESELLIALAQTRNELAREREIRWEMEKERGEVNKALEAEMLRAMNAEAECEHLAALRAKQDAELVSTREALAAARRENDDLTGRAMIRNGFLRAALERIAGGTEDPKEVARAALAAPAGTPDTSPATLEAWEKRLQREAEVNDPAAAAGGEGTR